MVSVIQKYSKYYTEHGCSLLETSYYIYSNTDLFELVYLLHHIHCHFSSRLYNIHVEFDLNPSAFVRV